MFWQSRIFSGSVFFYAPPWHDKEQDEILAGFLNFINFGVLKRKRHGSSVSKLVMLKRKRHGSSVSKLVMLTIYYNNC